MGRKGDVLYNPRRRERVMLVETAAETNGERLTMLVTQEPTTARMPAHFHPHQRETFTMKSGALTYVLGDAEPRVARAGDTLTVEPGVRHNWWNEGPEAVEMVGVLEPAGRWLEFMETIYGLTNEGKVSPRGIPNPLQMAVVAWEFRREWVPAALPAAARMTVLPILAAIGRAVGYRATYPSYAQHGPTVTPV